MLFYADRPEKEGKALQTPMVVMNEVADLLRKHYQLYVSPGTHHKTFEALKMTPGSQVYFKNYSKLDGEARGMKKLWPRYLAGEIVKLQGRTSAIIKNHRTGKNVVRHVSDVFPHYTPTWETVSGDKDFLDSM